MFEHGLRWGRGKQRSQLRYLMYGSCVSRDTFEFLPEPKELVGYIARQSMISAGTNAAALGAMLPRLQSPFQERMSFADIAGAATLDVCRLADQIDLLVLDLTDERGGVYRAGGGAFLTRTIERLGQGADSLLGADRIVHFGTEEHFTLWFAGWRAFVARLAEANLVGRTVMLAVPWAAASTVGARPPASFGLSPREANDLYPRYYDAVSASGVRVLRSRRRPTQVLADPAHRWGLAPFHYAGDVYVDLAAQLVRRVGARTPLRINFG